MRCFTDVTNASCGDKAAMWMFAYKSRLINPVKWKIVSQLSGWFSGRKTKKKQIDPSIMPTKLCQYAVMHLVLQPIHTAADADATRLSCRVASAFEFAIGRRRHLASILCY